MNNPLADALARKGRKGDDTVAHMDTGEIVVPPEVIAAMPELGQMLPEAFRMAGADIEQFRVGGGDDSVNPATGMQEFAWNEESQTEDGTSRDGYSSDESGYGNDGGDQGGYYQQEPNRGPVPGWSPTQNSPRNIVGNEPTEIGRGWVSALGVSPARYRNPMSGETHYGAGFNPGGAAGSIIGNIFGGPAGGMALGALGRQFTDTRFGFPGMDSFGYGSNAKPSQPRQNEGSDNSILAELLMQPRRAA